MLSAYKILVGKSEVKGWL